MIEIWSGGQTGVDIAALRAAKAAGLKTGGWMPKGFLAQDGAHPEYAELYGMRETETTDYPTRTRANVAGSDATLLLTKSRGTPGSILTARAAEALHKPFSCFVIYIQDGKIWGKGFVGGPLFDKTTVGILAQDLRLLLTPTGKTLNIAGNRDGDLEEPVELWLTDIFKAMALRAAK